MQAFMMSEMGNIPTIVTIPSRSGTIESSLHAKPGIPLVFVWPS